MSIRILGKGDLVRLCLFKQGDFEGYELYLMEFDEPEIKQKLSEIPGHLKIISIHNPTRVRIDGKLLPFDLGSIGKIGDESVRVLENTIKLAEQIGAKTIVVHGASYNSFEEIKEVAMQRLAERLKNIVNKTNLNITFETDALWYNLFFSRRALMTQADDFLMLEEKLGQDIKICIDIEHLHLTFYFKKFIESIGSEKYFLENFTEGDYEKFNLKIIPFIKENFDSLNQEFKKFLKDFYEVHAKRICHVHINGSDCCNFEFNSKTTNGLPLIGEHLPIAYQNEAEGISDKLDYEFLFNEIFFKIAEKIDLDVVIEAWRDDPQEFVKSYLESKQVLEKFYKNIE